MPPQHLLGYAQVSQQALQHRMLPGKAHGIVQIENFSSTFRRLKNPSRPVCITLGFIKVMGLLAISKPFNLSFFCVGPSPSQRLDLAHHPIHQKDFLQWWGLQYACCIHPPRCLPSWGLWKYKFGTFWFAQSCIPRNWSAAPRVRIALQLLSKFGFYGRFQPSLEVWSKDPIITKHNHNDGGHLLLITDQPRKHGWQQCKAGPNSLNQFQHQEKQMAVQFSY